METRTVLLYCCLNVFVFILLSDFINVIGIQINEVSCLVFFKHNLNLIFSVGYTFLVPR